MLAGIEGPLILMSALEQLIGKPDGVLKIKVEQLHHFEFSIFQVGKKLKVENEWILLDLIFNSALKTADCLDCDNSVVIY